MSATASGDTPKRKRAPRADKDMGVERDLGRLDGAVHALEQRADRNEAVTQARFQSVDQKLEALSANSTREFKEQNAKLDTLILRTAKEDGASESEKSAEESSISFWAKWSGFAIVVGTVAAILQPAVTRVWHFVVGH